MKIEMYGIPLPSEVLDLKRVHENIFFNTSYREYLSVYGEWIVGVYPFAIKIDRAFDSKYTITYDDFKLYGVKSANHHNDFLEGIIEISPCDIYEIVSGIKIHHGESDDCDMNIDHTKDIKLFNAEIISLYRENKLKNLGI